MGSSSRQNLGSHGHTQHYKKLFYSLLFGHQPCMVLFDLFLYKKYMNVQTSFEKVS
jgi:hypothetical protein